MGEESLKEKEEIKNNKRVEDMDEMIVVLLIKDSFIIVWLGDRIIIITPIIIVYLILFSRGGSSCWIADWYLSLMYGRIPSIVTPGKMCGYVMEELKQLSNWESDFI